MDDEFNCLYKVWIDDWKEEFVFREAIFVIIRQEFEILILDYDTVLYIVDLVIQGSIVVIVVLDDFMYDFFLLKVIFYGVEEFSEDFIDDYLCYYCEGSEVLKGYFYLRDNIYDMIYILDIKRVVVVFVVIVRYICGDFIVKRCSKKFIYKFLFLQYEEIIVLL